MKVLLVGRGKSNDGVALLLNKKNISFDYLNTEEITSLDYDLVVKSPGILYSNEKIKAFINLDKPVITDIELVYTFYQPFLIGVTGSNGKTTTINLINEVLRHRYDTVMCGNIGYSYARAVLENSIDDLFLCELSSFELEGIIKFAPKIAIMLNIKPCHLDHHSDFQDYINQKANITINQQKDDYLIYNYDDYNLREIAKRTKAKTISFSKTSTMADCYIFDNCIYLNGYKLFTLNKRQLKAKHNLENIMASCIVGHLLGIKKRRIEHGIFSFKGVEYRLEEIKEKIFNDAKSTNPYSTIEALKTLGENIILVCGGYNRKENLEVLNKELFRINEVYTYGQTAQMVKEYFGSKKIKCHSFINLEEAVLQAYRRKSIKEYLLYSPMFASYDQYESYQMRGKEFNNIINKIGK